MYISIRDCMVAREEFATPIEGLRHLGIDAVELELKHDYTVRAMDSQDWVSIASDADAKGYRQHLGGLGLRPAALLTYYDFTADDVERGIAFTARAIELAELLGVSCVRVDPAMQRERELSFQERVGLFVQAWGGALERTAGSKVVLGMENHGFQGNNLALQLNIYNRLGDRMGGTMDTGNFYWRGYPLSEVYGILYVLAPYAKHTHLKNIAYPEDTRETWREAGWEYAKYAAPIPDGDIDHARVVELLDEAGYDGDVCIEDESLGRMASPEARIEALERDTAHVKALIGAQGAAGDNTKDA